MSLEAAAIPIRGLLFADVFANLLQLETHRGHCVSTGPEVLAREIPLFANTSGPSLWRFSLSEIRSPRPPDTSEESRCPCAHGPAAGVPPGSGTPSAAPRPGILLPTCAVPGQTAPYAAAWAQTPHDTYSPNWNALTFDTFPT